MKHSHLAFVAVALLLPGILTAQQEESYDYWHIKIACTPCWTMSRLKRQ